MKKLELKQLIKEEIKKIIKEDNNYGEGYSYMKPFVKDIQRIIQFLEVLNNKIEQEGPLSEDIIDALESLQDLKIKIDQSV
jgi:hypothetical protein